MAILRESTNSSDSLNYVATVAFFCCVSCVTLMLKLGGFKASLNIFSGKRKNDKYKETGTDVALSGAYRTNRDEFYGTGRPSDPPKKFTPSMVKLPTTESLQPRTPIRTVKSTGNLSNLHNELKPNLRAAPSVSLDPRGEHTEARTSISCGKNNKNLDKEQKKLEKQKLTQEKVRLKQEAQEKTKQEKLRKEKEKKDAQIYKLERTKKRKAPIPVPPPLPQPEANKTIAHTSRILGQAPVQYSTNTLESSISRSSGPPPYTDDIKSTPNTSSSNIIFSKPVEDNGSWEMISQHRQQIDRPVQSGGRKEKQMVMDLNYNFNKNLSIHSDKENTDA